MSESTVTKSQVYKEDLALATGGTGAVETGTRRTSVGGTVTLTKLDAAHINYRSYARSLENTASTARLCTTEAELVAAIAAIGSGDGLIKIINAISLTDNMTFAAKTRIMFEPGAVLSIPTEKTLTINGTIDAGLYQIFSCTGTGKVVFGAGAVTEIYPEWWGSVGTGDDSTVLQAALDCPTNSTVPMTVRLTRQSYAIDTGLTLDTSYVMLEGGGTILDGSGLTGTEIALLVTNSVALSSKGSRFARDFTITGPGKATTVTGLKIESASAVLGVYWADFTNININNCGVGLHPGDNAFDLDFKNINFSTCGTDILMESGDFNGVINFFGGQLGSSDLGLNIASGAYVNFHGTNFDSLGLIADISSGYVFMNTCKIEGNTAVTSPYTSVPVVIGASGHLIMNGGWILCQSTLAATSINYFFQVDTTADSGLGLGIYDVILSNTLTATQQLCTGDGTIYCRARAFYGSGGLYENVLLHATSNNQVADGGFEDATVQSPYIALDSAAITSRDTGTSIVLTTSATEARTGSKSLRVEKKVGNPSDAAFAIIVPLAEANKYHGLSLWIKKPGTETGTIYIIGRYVQVQYINQYGTPIVGDIDTSFYLVGPTFTSATTDWTEYTPSTPFTKRPPHWATHVQLYIDVSSFDVGYLYIDDVIINAQ